MTQEEAHEMAAGMDLPVEVVELVKGNWGVVLRPPVSRLGNPTDAELVQRAVRNSRRQPEPRSQMNWVCVRNAFAVDSTSAIALCNRFGIDPFGEAGDPIPQEWTGSAGK